jgi:hypothetical protein
MSSGPPALSRCPPHGGSHSASSAICLAICLQTMKCARRSKRRRESTRTRLNDGARFWATHGANPLTPGPLSRKGRGGRVAALAYLHNKSSRADLLPSRRVGSAPTGGRGAPPTTGDRGAPPCGSPRGRGATNDPAAYPRSFRSALEPPGGNVAVPTGAGASARRSATATLESEVHRNGRVVGCHSVRAAAEQRSF